MIDTKIFSDIYLFENLDRDQLERLGQVSDIREFKKGAYLFFEGDDPNGLHILTKGVLKLYKSDIKGHEVVLKYFYPSCLVGELADLDHLPYPSSAVFETDGEVITINSDIFKKEFLECPAVSLSIIRSLSRKLRNLHNVISRNLTMDSTGRVAKFIYENEDLFSQLKQNKVAAILNITPETLSRVVRKFKEANIIEIRDHKFIVTDKEKLKEFFE